MIVAGMVSNPAIFSQTDLRNIINEGDECIDTCDGIVESAFSIAESLFLEGTNRNDLGEIIPRSKIK